MKSNRTFVEGRLDRHFTAVNRGLWAATYCLGQCVMTPFFRLKTMGIRHIPRQRGFVLLPKHQRWLDIPLLGLAAGNPLYYVAKHELFQYPLIRSLLKNLGGIPLNRERPVHSRWSFKAAVEVLRREEGLVLFPEGTYFQQRMGNGRSGFLRYLLKHAQVPLIPVGIEYTSKCFRTEVIIRFGVPVRNSQTSDVMDRIMADIAELSGLPSEAAQ